MFYVAFLCKKVDCRAVTLWQPQKNVACVRRKKRRIMEITKETKLTDLLAQYPWSKREMAKVNDSCIGFSHEFPTERYFLRIAKKFFKHLLHNRNLLYFCSIVADIYKKSATTLRIFCLLCTIGYLILRTVWTRPCSCSAAVRWENRHC